jgi:hypothetical protein
MPSAAQAIEVNSLSKAYGRHRFGQGPSLGVMAS